MPRVIASRLPNERLAAGEERVHAAEIAACLQAEIGNTSGQSRGTAGTAKTVISRARASW